MKSALTTPGLTDPLIPHTLSCYHPGSVIAYLIMCFPVSPYLIIQSLTELTHFIQGPFISGSVLPLADYIFQDSCSTFSHPMFSSCFGIDILSVKRYSLCFLPLNLSETVTAAEVMPHDF